MPNGFDKNRTINENYDWDDDHEISSRVCRQLTENDNYNSIQCINTYLAFFITEFFDIIDQKKKKDHIRTL